MSIGRAMLVAQAVERGEAIESVGVGKASPDDLTHYVLEIVREMEAEGQEVPNGNTIGAALFEIWNDGGEASGARYEIARYPA